MLFLDPTSICAVATVVAGVVLFAFSTRLPALFPPSVTRFVGFFAVATALFSFWVASGSWPATLVVGVLAVAALLVVHIAQTPHTAVPPVVETSPVLFLTKESVKKQGSSSDTDLHGLTRTNTDEHGSRLGNDKEG